MDKQLFSSELSPEFMASLPAIETGDALEESLPQLDTSSSLNAQLARAVKIAKQLSESITRSGMDKWFAEGSAYSIENLPKHKAFFEAGTEYPERLFLAANRVGKTIVGAFETACHLTGDYPSWWAGKVFDEPTNGWAVGPDARTVRDTIQLELLGAPGEWGTGMIPASKLGKFSGIQGVPGAIDMIRIRHKSGGWSTLGFKNYKQDVQAFMGTSRQFIWCDEEVPIEIWNECNIRTATTDGIMLATFTPLEGLTRMVINFCKNAEFLAGSKPVLTAQPEPEEFTEIDDRDMDESVGFGKKKAVVQAGWNDAPWLDAKTKDRLLSDTPEHLKKARSEGIPSMGSGNVFPIAVEQILCDPFEIPDNWPRMYALDVGWNKTAVIWAALDPNSDTLYFYDEHYRGGQEPYQHAYVIKTRGEWIHGVIDPATRGRGQADGSKLYSMYKKEGLKLFLAKNEREAGILAMTQRLSTGKLKVFRTLVNFQSEYIVYRRDTRGRVVDEDDHLMDASRYIINNLNRMISKSQIKPTLGDTYRTPTYDI